MKVLPIERTDLPDCLCSLPGIGGIKRHGPHRGTSLGAGRFEFH
jgi:hypothetical protein